MRFANVQMINTFDRANTHTHKHPVRLCVQLTVFISIRITVKFLFILLSARTEFILYFKFAKRSAKVLS